MKRIEFEISLHSKMGKGKVAMLTYTIVMIDGKVKRIFNHAHSRGGFLVNHTIELGSETGSRLVTRYETLLAASTNPDAFIAELKARVSTIS